MANAALGRPPAPPPAHHLPPGRRTNGLNGAPSHHHGYPASTSADRPCIAPVGALALRASPEGGGPLLARVRAALSRYPYGAFLPSVSALAAELGEQDEHVRKALGRLESAGELVQRNGRRPAGYRYRLRPDEPHPQDVELDRAVREGIRSGRYAVGTPLPTGLLGQEHRVPATLIPRALRHLVSGGYVSHRDGHAGPGYYVAARPRTASHAAATRGARR
ncbi:GntR family transcriptional regulator [Streptomyces sp. NBRC 110465]|uniref:GntR family transcriptional regulator n=1 Tax=Streptomyces sp. NBRC 110465 TaxID=1897621 RepID=UPI001F014693